MSTAASAPSSGVQSPSLSLSPELKILEENDNRSLFIGWLELVFRTSNSGSTDDQKLLDSLVRSKPAIPICQCTELLNDIVRRISQASKKYDPELHLKTQQALTALKAQFTALRTPNGSSSPTAAGKFVFKPIR